MPWQNGHRSPSWKAEGKSWGSWFHKSTATNLAFQIPKCESRITNKLNPVDVYPRWDTGRSAVSKVPLAFLWARLCAARRCWILLVSAASSLSLQNQLCSYWNDPQKRGTHATMGVLKCLKHIVYIYCIYIPFYWFVWCVIFSSNTQPMTCPLQVLIKANPTKATSTAASIAVSKPAQWIPSPKIIPSVDQQSHTWDDSEIVIHRRCTHIVTYHINCSRIWDTMSFRNGRPTVVPCKKKIKKTTNLWMDNPLFFLSTRPQVPTFPTWMSIQLCKYQSINATWCKYGWYRL